METTPEQQREVPVLFEKRKHCCGCSACYAICPAGAIRMQPNKAGFSYPAIDNQKCTRCYKCLHVCAFQADPAEKRDISNDRT